MTRLPVRENEDGEPGTEDEAFASVSEAFRTAPEQEGAVFRTELREAIQALPAEEREAVVLVHALGYSVESDDPGKETAATRCGVSGRTIRKRLKKAADRLADFRKELRRDNR